MKRFVSLLLAILLLLCACSSGILLSGCAGQARVTFTENEKGNLINDRGEEYALLAVEGDGSYYLGELELYGRVKGEKRSFRHMGMRIQTGLFAIKGSEDNNILVRYQEDNEWYMIYRKTSLPALDLSLESCVRLELVRGYRDHAQDVEHATCMGGITDPQEIAAFLAELREGQTAKEAGLYDLVKLPNGMLENCYVWAGIYGFFADEPSLAIYLEVISYNDLAYSVTFEGEEPVLSAAWIERLQGA